STSSAESTSAGGRILVDLNTTIYFILVKQTLWGGDSAFKAIDTVLFNKFSSRNNIILYIDGQPAAEKDTTSTERWKMRYDKLKKAAELIQLFEKAVKNELSWPGKQKDQLFRSNLQGCWYMSSQKRKSLGDYLQEQGWKVQHADFEADVAIAKDCKPNDIVVSTDSDMLAYDSIKDLQ
ncbi:hypothetical protein CPB97_005556, partial [Podila verticillata]